MIYVYINIDRHIALHSPHGLETIACPKFGAPSCARATLGECGDVINWMKRAERISLN